MWADGIHTLFWDYFSLSETMLIVSFLLFLHTHTHTHTHVLSHQRTSRDEGVTSKDGEGQTQETISWRLS